MRDDDALENNPRISLAALAEIHEQVFGWALSRCDFDAATAEDLVQQAYVELLSGAARFDGRSSLVTFVFSVVQNLARNRYRRLGNRMRLVRQHAALAQTPVPDTEPAADNAAVWDAVRALPARQRDVIELVFCRELTIEDASTVMGVSVGTGRTHYDRAKRALRERLAAMETEA